MFASLSGRRRAFFGGLALVVSLAIAAVAISVSRSTPATRAVGVPIVVVPGYGGDARSVRTLLGALGITGRSVHVVVGADSGRGPVAESATLLDRAIRDLGTDEVDLIGYSAGGVVVRYWSAQEDRSADPRRIVTIGSPHHGTSLAAGLTGLSPADCVAACAELRPGSDLLRRLGDPDETPTDAVWTSVWTADDETVVPPETASLSGAANVRLQDLCPGVRVTHSGLVTDQLPLRVVVAAIEPGSVAATGC